MMLFLCNAKVVGLRKAVLCSKAQSGLLGGSFSIAAPGHE
jgi:hypothetical protein